MYYASVAVLALIVHIIINIEALRNVAKTHENGVRLKYRFYLFALIAFYVSDSLWGSFYEQRWVIPTFIVTCTFFISMTLSVLFWTRAVVEFTENKGKSGKILIGCGWMIFLFELVVLIINLFVPIAFSFSADKEYLPLPARYITLHMQVILFLATAIYAFVLAGKNKDTAYNDEYLIIIDDPVSSYDFENKIGILSFLKYKLSQFLNGNVNSSAVVMTHDLLTLFDLEKISQELNSEWKRVFLGQPLKYHLWELENCAFKRFEYRKRQEYTELVRLIYEYGCGNAGEYDIVIGNIMRQALEAFATFEFKKGIADVSTDETLLAGMCEEHKSYFKNLMYRIVLNNGSHREEQAQSMEIDFLSVISEVEKRRTAKEIICFIYLLNKAHILAHLGDVSSTIETWCEEVKARSAVI